MRFVWVGFLLMIAIVGFLYIILDYAQDQMVPEMSESLTNTMNIEYNNYMRMIWYSLPIVFLMIFGYWAWSQGQKDTPYG